jgi:hypothetical protein
MGLRQRLITEFCPKPHSESEISVLEAPNNGTPNRANGKEAMVELVGGLRQRFITEFVEASPHAPPRAQLTLTGDILPVSSKDNNGRSPDKNLRLFHFTEDPSPVLTVARVRIVKNDNAHIKLRLQDDLLKKLSRCGRIEIYHFSSIKEEHSYNVEEPYIRIGTGRFYTSFYNSGETALVKLSGDKLIIVTKIGHHPRDYLQFRNVEYRNATAGIPMVKTTKGRILPLSFYVQAEKEFPSIVEVVGKPKRIKIRGSLPSFAINPIQSRKFQLLRPLMEHQTERMVRKRW